MYKILINHTPECLCDIVERCLLVSQYYSLCNNNLFHIPITRTVACYNSSLPSTVKLWNTLPDSVQFLICIANFKQSIQNKNPVDKIKYEFDNHWKMKFKYAPLSTKTFF